MNPRRRLLGSLSIVALVSIAASCGSSDAGDTGATGSGASAVSTSATTSSGGGGASTTASTSAVSIGATTSTASGMTGNPNFPAGHVFIAGSRNAQVFEYDGSLNLVESFTDPSFGTVMPFPGQDFNLGPAGMAFDQQGNLVVATTDSFCVFTAPGHLLACHPKANPEPTENIIFDLDGNLYTTTSTGGTDEVRKYDASYNPVAMFTLPTPNLTGVTCDPQGNLYVASQLTSTSIVYKVDKAAFSVLDMIPIQGTAEGLQFASDGNLLVGLDADQGILRVTPNAAATVVQSIVQPGLTWAVPLTTDNQHRIYTADYENGNGSAASDLFVFDDAGNVAASRLASEVWGPFGEVVAGAVLPCGAYQLK